MGDYIGSNTNRNTIRYYNNNNIHNREYSIMLDKIAASVVAYMAIFTLAILFGNAILKILGVV